MGAIGERSSTFSRSDETEAPAPGATSSKGKVSFVEPSVLRFEGGELENKAAGIFDGVASTMGDTNVWETSALKEEQGGVATLTNSVGITLCNTTGDTFCGAVIGSSGKFCLVAKALC
ncbi:hypothetical protein ACA910_016512 [Epithemia clementina (nom. ined.)]